MALTTRQQSYSDDEDQQENTKENSTSNQDYDPLAVNNRPIDGDSESEEDSNESMDRSKEKPAAGATSFLQAAAERLSDALDSSQQVRRESVIQPLRNIKIVHQVDIYFTIKPACFNKIKL